MYIHNISGTEKTYSGQSIDNDSFWLIPDILLLQYANNETLITDVMNGDAAISSDGVNDISEKIEMVNTLKGKTVLIDGFNNESSIQKAIPVINHKAEETSFARATHDFCNKTTWYTNSVEIVDEVATTGDDLVFDLTKEYLIDVINGVVNRQDLHQAYKVIVKVDDVVITRRELISDVPTSNYTIDHGNGTITFPSAETGTVKVTYYYATDSQWTIAPDASKILIIEHSEVQFADDVKIIDTNLHFKLKFEVWVGNPYYAVVGHPYEGMPKIPYETVNYNSIKDVINESNLGTGKIEQVADLPDNVRVFPFNYVTVKAMKSSQLVETRVFIEDEFGRKDQELTGSFATATFYLISRDE